MPPSKKIRIAIVRQKYTPHGGAERFVHNMLSALEQRKGVEITLITRQWDKKNAENIRILKCNPFYIGRLWRDWSFAYKACQIINKHRNEFDLVQSHERILCADIYRAGEGVHREWLAQRQRVRPWWRRILDLLSPYHAYTLKQEQLLFESARLRALITNSNITKIEIQHHFPKHKAPISVIPNAVDEKKFHHGLQNKHRLEIRSKLHIPSEHYVSVFVGSGYERKGIPQLLKVFKQLGPQHHLLIVGKDKNQRDLEKKAEKMGIIGQVHFIGPQLDVRPYLGASDLFVFPSLYDPLPNSALEAAASGLPVVASKTTGAADLTKSSGITPPDPLDTNAWITAIKLSSKTQLPLADMTKYTQKAMSNQLWSLYQEILRNKDEAL